MTETVKLTDCIAPFFYDLHNDIQNHGHTHYKLKGGRSSGKSSFVSIEIILGIMMDPEANAACFRKVKDTLKDSVFEQLLWAIDTLHVNAYWKTTLSPLQLTYIKTGQKIIFRGLDDPMKSKSINVHKGYFKYIWFEERAELDGDEDERTVLQSLMRKGSQFVVFYTWNPPKSINSWVNQDVLLTPAPDTVIHHSTYLDLPRNWVSDQTYEEANKLKQRSELKYRHEYLGEATGTGGKVFDNVVIRTITPEEREMFDKVKHGLDFGFAADPLAYTKNHLNRKKQTLYIFGEIYQVQLKTSAAVELIRRMNPLNQIITADSEEPRSIDTFNEHGLKLVPAKKGPGSVDHGIRWLQDLSQIVIDPDLCPNTAREFAGYELERDKNGNFKGSFPDKNNHSIDATRYSREDDMIQRKAKIKSKSRLGFR